LETASRHRKQPFSIILSLFKSGTFAHTSSAEQSATMALPAPQAIAPTAPTAPTAPAQPSSPAGETTAPVYYPLTGFVRIEEDGDRRSRKPATASSSASKAAASVSSSRAKAPKGKVCSRWLYGVLLLGKLQLYARRTDYKRHTPPCDEILLRVKASSPNESVFGFDHECVYIRSKDSSRVVTVRIHQKKDIVRWVTALYYQSFNTKSPLAGVRSAELSDGGAGSSNTEDADAFSRSKRKSVSFQEEPEVLVLPRQSYDPADLFYSELEYEQFQQQDEPTDAPSSSSSKLSSLMKSIYAKTAAKLKVSPKKNMGKLR